MTWPTPGEGPTEPIRPGDRGAGETPPPPPPSPSGEPAPPVPPPPPIPPPPPVAPPSITGEQMSYPAQGAPGYPPPYQAAPPARTNAMAVAALICALGGLITIISAPVGAILGHVARRQIRETGEEGDGMALAGIIIGWSLTGLLVAACCLAAAVGIFGVFAFGTTTTT